MSTDQVMQWALGGRLDKVIDEIVRLQAENERLRAENEQLRKRLGKESKIGQWKAAP